jgi:dTDP-4-dehydrorhamnose reductase
MSNKTLFILGASGLTGYKTMQQAKDKFEAYGTYNLRAVSDNKTPLIKLDITKENDLKKVFMKIKPDIVLNTTALHNVDYCESHEQEAYNINSNIVGIIADLCNNLGSRLIHISTDFVFDGNKIGGNYVESDNPNPLSIYAKSKLAGELQAKRCNSYSILRPSVVYGWTPLETQGSTSSSGKPMNFALWVLSKLNRGEEIKAVNDQYTSPTLADILAEVALKVAIKDKNEIYHISGNSCLSRYEFTKKISQVMGYSDNNNDDNYIKPIESNSFVQLAKRPINSCLNCEKLQNELNYNLPNVDRSLAIMRSQIEVESPSLIRNGNKRISNY